eukprot:10212697-Lingulodinium_polyedra.AAC.1
MLSVIWPLDSTNVSPVLFICSSTVLEGLSTFTHCSGDTTTSAEVKSESLLSDRNVLIKLGSAW